MRACKVLLDELRHLRFAAETGGAVRPGAQA